jgi:hypothetical protein
MKKILLALTFASAAGACAPKDRIVYRYITILSDAKDINPGETKSATTDKSDIVMSGSLVIGGEGTALSLASEDYSLFCVTFENEPIGFSVATENDGTQYSFNQTLPDAAGRPFGCFLRKAGVTKSTVEFSGGSTMLAGGGELVFDINYDPDTQLSTARVDVSKSSALYPEAVAAAKTDRGAIATSLGDLTGRYNVTCDADPERGLSCEQLGKSLPTSLYIGQFESGYQNKIAVWDSQAKRNQCVPASASEANPRFGFGLSTAQVDFLEFDYRGDTEFTASMERVWGQLSAADPSKPSAKLKESIVNRVSQMESWRVGQCSQLDDKFKDENCRFSPTYYNVYSYPGSQKGENVTQKNPMWFSKFCVGTETPAENNCAPADYTGTVTSKPTACTEYWTRDMPMCPAGTDVNDSGKGIFNAYYGLVNGEEVPMRLACRGTTEGWVSFQDEARAKNKADAIVAAKDSIGCDLITALESPGSPFIGSRKLEKIAVVNALAELSLFPLYHKASNICRNRLLPADFNFAKCPETSVMPDWAAAFDANNINYNTDQSTILFCHDMHLRYSQLSLKIDRVESSPTYGKLIQDPEPTSNRINSWQAQEFCPDEYKTYESSNKNSTAEDTFNAACMQKMTALTLAEQLSAGMRSSIGIWNTITYVACGDVGGTARIEMQAGMNLACLPQANISMQCDTTKCVSRLRCDGTERGKCYSNDEFMGRIAGRIAVMDLKESVNMAFEASSTVVDQFPIWNPKGTPKDASNSEKGNGAMEVCTMVNSASLNGQAKDRVLDGYFKNRIKRKCEPMPAGFIAAGGMGGSAATGGMGGSAATGLGGNAGADPTQSLPEFDLLMKVKFTKP